MTKWPVKFWTAERNNRLEYLWCTRRLSHKAIAADLDTSVSSVSSQIARLKIRRSPVPAPRKNSDKLFAKAMKGRRFEDMRKAGI